MDIKAKLEQSIAFLSDDLLQLQDPFYLIGSSALILAGIPLKTSDDIDLLTSYRDAIFLKKHWQANKVDTYSPKDADKFRSNFGRFQWDKILVEVMGNLEVFHEEKWQRLIVKEYFEIDINHLKIRIPTLKEQHRVFCLFGREKDLAKAVKIVKHIEPV